MSHSLVHICLGQDRPSARCARDGRREIIAFRSQGQEEAFGTDRPLRRAARNSMHVHRTRFQLKFVHNNGGRHEQHRRDRNRDPPLPRRDSGGAAGRPAPAHRGDALAQQGARRRSVAGRAAGDAAGARALLGDRLRLAQGRGEAQRAAAVHDRDRRGRHPLHPREVAARERVAADHDARLARLGHRAARDRRPAHRPDRARRTRRGRVRPRAAVPARLRLLRRARPSSAGTPAASRRPGRS